MRKMGRLSRIRALATFFLICAPAVGARGDDEGLSFFEKKIRPVLVEQCYSCHSDGANRIRGGLRLDSRAGLLAGGDSGPALVPGKPAESLIVEALKYDGLEMPPKGRLSSAVVADFERWITMGAPDPRVGPAARAHSSIDLEAGRRFWAYQQPRHRTTPDVAASGWIKNDVDRFVLAGLKSRGLRPVAPADRPTLVRRLSFDLVGLPPCPEEVDRFVADASPDAYERLVDRLLASPEFGERWGRHWLDVARFAESMTLRGLVLDEAWRYRDYVVNAFNADMPFDRFLREQIAGDLLPTGSLEERRRGLVATTFLALGDSNLEEQDKAQLRMDVVDEQLDTIGKAFLAQTIGCARCHDHKFDPIPTRDYYALAGILRNVKTHEDANVSKWLERPLPVDAAQELEFRCYDQAVADLERRIKLESVRAAARGGIKSLARGAIAETDLPGVVLDDSVAKRVGEWKVSRFSPDFIGQGYLHDLDSGKGEKSLTFQPDLPRAGEYEVRLAYSPGANRATDVPVTILSAGGETSVSVNLREPPPLAGRFVSLGQYRFERNGQGYVLISNEGTHGHVVIDAVLFIPVDPGGSPQASSPSALSELEAQLKRLKAEAPKRESVISVLDLKDIEDARVHVRGSVHSLGESVPRGFLQVASYGPKAEMPRGESGRRELADWLASRENPLTARVFVNRAWHWLFGVGLVRTTDNFGTTGEIPSHPELLDELALRFMEDGWSIKSLVRSIVLSQTYQLSTLDDPRARAADPENRRLWRQNRRRLDAECLRDAILTVSGALRPEKGGPSFRRGLAADFGYPHAETRRSVYSPAFRNALPELFEAFDFANPSMVVGQRNVSTVVPQALYLLNHPFVVEQSRVAARRVLDEPSPNIDARLARAYRLALGRTPTEGERKLALGFLEGEADADSREAQVESWSILIQSLFGSIDFRYAK